MIALENLHKTYRKAGQPPVHALDGLTLQVARGEFVAILGPSGSGKSTLMNVMGLLDKPDQGSYRLNGRDMLTAGEGELAGIRASTISPRAGTFWPASSTSWRLRCANSSAPRTAS